MFLINKLQLVIKINRQHYRVPSYFIVLDRGMNTEFVKVVVKMATLVNIALREVTFQISLF